MVRRNVSRIAPAKAEFHICFSDYNGLNGLS